MLPPRIDTSRLKQPVVAKLAHPVTLTVDVSGYPRPSVRWYVGRREVREGDGLQLAVDGRTYELHVDQATDDLARGVTVIAANSVGVYTSEIPVKVYKVLRSQNFLQRSISQTLRSPDSVVLQRRRKLRLIRPGQSLSSFGSFSSFQYDHNVSRTFSERPRRPSTADSLQSESSGHWPPACSPRHGRRVFDFELQNLPSSPASSRRYLSSGDPDVSFECIQEPSERTIGGRHRYHSDAVFDDVRARAPIASTPEVNAIELSPTPPPQPQQPEVTSEARLRTVRSKPPPAPPMRSSSLVSSPSSSTATECTSVTQRSPRQSASPSPRREISLQRPASPSPHREPIQRLSASPTPRREISLQRPASPSPHRESSQRQSASPSPRRETSLQQSASPSLRRETSPQQGSAPSTRRETNGFIPSSPEGIVNPAFRPSVSLEKQVSEFFEPSAMEPEVDDGDDIWRLMGFKLSELCRVILKDPEEPEEQEEKEEEPTEEPEVKPLSKTTADEPIRERQSNRVSEFSRLPPTNTGESVTCVRGGSTGVTDNGEKLTNQDRAVAFGRRPETTSQRDVGDVSGGTNLDGVSRDRTEPSVDGHGQRKPVAFVSPFTAECPHEQEQANDQVDLRRGRTKHVVQGRVVDDVSDYDIVKSKAGADLACPFVWQNGAIGGRSRDADVIAGNHVDDTGVDSRTVGVVGSVTGTDGDSIPLTNTGSRAKDNRDSTITDAQQNGANEGSGVISSRSGKKQKSSKSRDGKEKKKGKKHKKGKKNSPWDCCGSIKASEQNILEQETEETSVIPIRHTAIDSTTIYASNDTHDVMYSEGIIEIPTGVQNGGLGLAKVHSQENSVEENQPIGGAATGSSRSSEVEEILQHAQEVDKYVREIKTQHDLTYGTNDVSKSDVITSDGSDVKLTGDSPNDNSSVRSDGSSSAVATAETGDVTSPGARDSLADPVRRPARTKRGKLRQIVELNRGGSDEHRVVEIQVVPASDCGRTDIQALIASTEAINVDALVDESLRQCLASMTFARPDYRPPAEDSGTDDAGGVPVKRRKREEGENGSDVAEGRITRSCEGDFTQQEPLPDQWSVTKIPGKDVSQEDTPASDDQLDVEYASNEGSGEPEVHKHRQVRSPAHTDEVTDVVGHVDTGERRASGSLSDDILFDEGYRVDDARELEMDAVSDEISLASFNTVIAVEATLTSTEPRQADFGVTADKRRESTTDDREATETISTDKDDATTTMASDVNTASADFEKTGVTGNKETPDDTSAVNGTTDDASAVNGTTDDASAVNGTTDDASAVNGTTDDASAVNGTTDDDFDESIGELSTEPTERKDGRAFTRGSSLPQSERTERFEYEVRGQVVETTRDITRDSSGDSPRDSPPLSRGSSVDRCESFECEVRKQLHRPSVSSGGPDADPRDPEVDELRTRSPVSLSRDSTTPESDTAAEIELKIVESDDDGDNDVVAATSRDTHARLYTLENTSDDYDVTRSHDNVEAYGVDSEESDSDAGRDCEREEGSFYAADGREKTARAPVSDVIAFNENAGNSRARTYSGGSATSSQTDNDFDALAAEYEKMACDSDVGESTDVTARNGEFQNDVIMDKETDVSSGVATDEIQEHSADDRRGDVTSTSDTEDIPRGYDTVLPSQHDQTLQDAVIPGACSSMITPIIVITEYCEPTPGSASYDGTFDLDDCPSGACDMNVADNVTCVDDVSEGDYSPNRCEQDSEDNMYETTREPVTDDGDETRGGSTGSSSDRDETAPDKQPGTPDDDVDVDLLTSDSDDVVSDNKEDNASADVPGAVDVSEPEVRRRQVGGASATTPEGATFTEQAPRRQTAPKPPESASALSRQPEAASAVVGRRGQDFLSDLFVEKACLGGFFSNIGSLVFLLLAVFLFHMMDMFSRNYSPD